ncbi:MAG: DUF2284 domain-containing protein [Acidobacteriota bacterium]|nr:DUF2284 domain-containing protein [Acidobacteriota bacterium]
MTEGRIEYLIKEAREAGFDAAGGLDRSTVALYPDVRAACEVNRCGRFGKSWSCPPACGTLEECAARLGKYSAGLIVQTVGRLEDEFDAEGMDAAGRRHAESFRALSERLWGEFPDMLPVGTASCSLCGRCTWPDAPCRNPRGAFAPMEAYGMMVSEICRRNGLDYYHGKGTITFTACYFLE